MTKCQLKNLKCRFNLAHGFRVISPLWWRWHGRTHNIGSREAGRGVPGTGHILGNGPRDSLRSHLPTQWHQQGTNPSTWGLWGDTLYSQTPDQCLTFPWPFLIAVTILLWVGFAFFWWFIILSDSHGFVGCLRIFFEEVTIQLPCPSLNQFDFYCY